MAEFLPRSTAKRLTSSAGIPWGRFAGFLPRTADFLPLIADFLPRTADFLPRKRANG